MNFWIDSDQPVQPPTPDAVWSVENSGDSKGTDQTAHMRRLVWAFAGHTYNIVGNLMSRLKCWLSKKISIFLVIVYFLEINDYRWTKITGVDFRKLNENKIS